MSVSTFSCYDFAGFFSKKKKKEIFEITKQIYANLFRKALPQNQLDINIEMFWQ